MSFAFRGKLFGWAVALVLASGCLPGQVNVLTFHNDNARTGNNSAETLLSPSNVKAGSFGVLFTVPVDGKVDAQPLQVTGVVIPGRGTHNVVYAPTEHDSVYAFDANRGTVYWHVSLLRSGESPSDDRGCGQVVPEIGITSTPVIDLTAGPHGTIYLVAMSRDSSGNYYQRLHALDITTGAEEFGGPVTVQATYPGKGANSKNGQVIFDAKQYKDRAGLLLLNGVVYTSWGSHCDFNPYTGWLIGYDRATLKQTSVFNFAPNGSEAALWNSGGGPAADSSGNIFAAVANGTFDTSLNAQGFPSGGDFGNAFVKLTLSGGKLQASDYWTMDNSRSESSSDTDLGSGGLMLLPDEKDSTGKVYHLAVGAGKDHNLYVVNRDNMGKFDATSNGTIYQELGGALPGGIWSSPAYFNNHVYFGPQGSPLVSFAINNARLSAASSTSLSFGYPGITPSVSADGTANSIVWAVENRTPAVLHAFDPANLGIEYYSSSQLGPGNKYIAPTIANGQVFVGTTNSIVAFGVQPKLSLANGTYSVIGQMSTLVLEESGANNSLNSSSQIIQAAPAGAANEKWTFTAIGGGYYTIRNESSGLYVTDPNGSKSLGTKLEEATANGSTAQQWSLSISNSGYVIRNRASGLVIDDSGYSTERGTVIQLWSATGNSNQAWIIQ